MTAMLGIFALGGCYSPRRISRGGLSWLAKARRPFSYIYIGGREVRGMAMANPSGVNALEGRVATYEFGRLALAVFSGVLIGCVLSFVSIAGSFGIIYFISSWPAWKLALIVYVIEVARMVLTMASVILQNNNAILILCAMIGVIGAVYAAAVGATISATIGAVALVATTLIKPTRTQRMDRSEK